VIFQNEDAISAFFGSVVQTFLLRHGFLLSSDVQPAPQKRRRMTTGEDSCRDKTDIRDPRQTFGKTSAPPNTHITMPITHERGDVPPLHVNSVSKNVLPSVLVLTSSSAQGDVDDENGVVKTDPSSGIPFVLDQRTGQSYHCTSLSRELDEDSTQTICPTRRTIAVPDSGDREGEPPSWILDALKVGIACAGRRLETYKYHGRIILLTLLESNQSPRSLSDFQIFSLFLPSLLRQRVLHTLVATPTAPSSSTNHLHGAFKRVIFLV